MITITTRYPVPKGLLGLLIEVAVEALWFRRNFFNLPPARVAILPDPAGTFLKDDPTP